MFLSFFVVGSFHIFTAAWKNAITYGGIALGVLLILLVAGLFIYKKTHNDRVGVFCKCTSTQYISHYKPLAMVTVIPNLSVGYMNSIIVLIEVHTF